MTASSACTTAAIWTAAQDAGPGYLKDFPNTDGVCANCHAPGAGHRWLFDYQYERRPRPGNGRCTLRLLSQDRCAVLPGSGIWLCLSQRARSTVSQRMLRPPAGEQIFFGPYDDIKDPDTYLPLISESAFCAPCHQFSFWGTPIYESFDEWLASPYAGQRYHLPGLSHATQQAKPTSPWPKRAGCPTRRRAIPSHLQLGAADAGFVTRFCGHGGNSLPGNQAGCG